MDVGTSPCRVRRENPDITFPQASQTARAEATSLVRETRAKVGDLKGKVPYYIVRLRVLLVKKHESA